MPEAGTPVGIRGWYPPGNWIYCMLRPTEDQCESAALCRTSHASSQSVLGVLYCHGWYSIDNAFFTLGFWIFDWKNRPGLIHSV